MNSIEQAQQTPDGKSMTVAVVAYEPEKMVSAALGEPRVSGDVSGQHALAGTARAGMGDQGQVDTEADSSSEDDSAEGVVEDGETVIPIGQSRVAEQVRYAVSPIVIAAWEDVARDLDGRESPVGWQNIQQLAAADAELQVEPPEHQQRGRACWRRWPNSTPGPA